jgi:release factor glutamine methyltransferase
MSAPSASSGTVGEMLASGTASLEGAGGEEQRANDELLLAYLLDTDRGGLFVRRGERIGATLAERYAEWIRRRSNREPLQHVTGEQEFYGLALASDRRALVARPETEGIVEAVLKLVPPRGARVADLGTGGGCIAVALAVQRPDLAIEALDISADALALARENAVRHGVESRIRFTRADFTDPPEAWRGVMDLVVSNPPYARDDEWDSLEPEVRDQDPRSAIVAGPTGLEAYGALAPVSFGLLCAGGRLVLELGMGQAPAVSEIASDAGLEVIDVRPDFCGIERVLVARKPEAA